MSTKNRVIIYLPAFNSAKTLKRTIKQIPGGSYDEFLLVDDGSQDNTIEIAKKLRISTIIKLPHNSGYGCSQKIAYLECLRRNADIVVVLHPDDQYDPTKLPELIEPIVKRKADVVMGSRFLPSWREAVKGGMPLYKIISNRILTFLQNQLFGTNFSETHTGFWAYSRKFLETAPFLRNNNDFSHGSQLLAQAVFFGFKIAEVAVSCRYHKHMSSTNFKTSLLYGFKTLWTAFDYWLNKHKLRKSPIFQK